MSSRIDLKAVSMEPKQKLRVLMRSRNTQDNHTWSARIKNWHCEITKWRKCWLILRSKSHCPSPSQPHNEIIRPETTDSLFNQFYTANISRIISNQKKSIENLSQSKFQEKNTTINWRLYIELREWIFRKINEINNPLDGEMYASGSKLTIQCNPKVPLKMFYLLLCRR